MEGQIVWVNGPFRGSENDLAIFRRGLLQSIPQGKLVIGDRGYRGEAVVSTPNPQDSEEITSFKSAILARHETANKRFKDFAILHDTFRHNNGDPIGNHGPIFKAVAVITQLLSHPDRNRNWGTPFQCSYLMWDLY